MALASLPLGLVANPLTNILFKGTSGSVIPHNAFLQMNGQPLLQMNGQDLLQMES